MRKATYRATLALSKKKLIVGFVLILCVNLIISVAAFYLMHSAEKNAEKLSVKYVPEVELCARMNVAVLQRIRLLRAYDFTKEAKTYEEATELSAIISDDFQKLKKQGDENPELEKLNAALPLLQKLNREYSNLMADTKAKVEGINKAQEHMKTAPHNS
ncbi:MAG: hypothetical protein WCO60_13595 [Verrucomicrobiota bacterium]